MRSLRAALALFTVVPVPPGWHADAAARARGALRWLPALGAALGAAAGLVATAVLARSGSAVLLGAALAVGTLALLSRGLHLDGLADTADGLGSRAPAPRALEIMKQSDIGPFGVLAIAVVLLVDVSALAAVAAPDRWRAPAALAVAAATGRLAALHAAPARPARTGGFGALASGAVRPAQAIALTTAVLVGAGALAAAVGASISGWILASAGALVLAAVLRAHCIRRFGGMTGDVFGALIEVTTAAVLVGLALS